MDMPVLSDLQTYIHHCADIGCSLEDLPRAMDDWDGW